MEAMGFRRPLVGFALIAAFSFAAACGSREPPPVPETPVDFTYELDGEQRRLSGLRGRPLVLVLMRTAELVSEMYLYETKAVFQRTAGEIRFLALSLEPSEAPLLQPYAEFHQLPFPLGFAEFAVAAGESDLGRIPVVPSTYLIGADGRVAGVFAGVTRADDLVREIERLGRR